MNEPSLPTKTTSQVKLYLDAYHRLIANTEFYIALDPPMDESEQLDTQMAFMQYWGQRHLLGDLYRAGELDADQVTYLANLDRQLLENAAAIERVYGPTLRQLIYDLLTWGTPLTSQSGAVRVETTMTALAELVDVTRAKDPL